MRRAPITACTEKSIWTCLKPEKICTFEDLQDAVAIMQEDKVLSEEMACALLRRRRDGC